MPDYRAQRRVWAAQARALKQQQRADRARLKMQRRLGRRRSIAGPLLILGLGVVFLLIQTGRLAWGDALGWYQRWWPTILIGAGLIMVAEWALDRARGGEYAVPGRRLGGGVGFLLVLLLGCGLLARAGFSGVLPYHSSLLESWHSLARVAGQHRTFDTTLSEPLPSGGSLNIRNPFGDVTVSGTSTDGQVHVTVETQVYAWTARDADRMAEQIQPKFSQQGSALVLDTGRNEGSRTDLTIEAPANMSVNIDSGEGDAALDAIHGQVTVFANRGDVTLSNIQGQVSAHVHDDNASVTAHKIEGPLSVEGRVGDVSLSDIGGSVLLQGDFFGQTTMERVSGPAHFQSSRTDLQCERVTEQLEIDGGPDLQGTGLVGPVILRTSNRNITLDQVEGTVQVQNRNGSVSVTSAAPLAGVNIQDSHGTVDLGIPASARFSVNAETRNGEIENDFSLQPEGDKEHRTLQGIVAGGGPTISLVTSDGDIVLRKSAVAPPPVPATPPAPPAPPAKARRIPKIQEENF